MARTRRARIGRPPASDAEPTAKRILSAALRLFAERGFAATTVRQIAAEVGVTDAALYAHFASKQAIYDSLVDRMGPPTPELLGFDAAAVGSVGPEVAIPAAVERLLAHWSKPDVRIFTAVLLREGHRGLGAGGLAASIEAARTALTPVFAAWREAGIDLVRIPDPFDHVCPRSGAGAGSTAPAPTAWAPRVSSHSRGGAW